MAEEIHPKSVAAMKAAPGAKQGYRERSYSFVAMNDIGPSLLSRGVEENDDAMRPW